ncbi:methyltransferase family protein [Winogradskyella epiphytica]|uniref:Methyltransferase family protein n=1 Tax=Winogradskyella epiphytica TaxID=262005 RepID=A0A2V4XBZ3_9FLAO|nr:class I SAM-dependent methyltransferase [Winogradskyella epiphytica]PYE80001.1 methyltransferase family protein [Winogradskyella epiphytica]GGW73075.1 hypothetical protein GCM10008085_26620 [Winogradskyella epiphytica]
MTSNRKQHWETVYETKNPDQVSWTQDKPKTSLEFIRSFNLEKTAKIIDIGGGDSRLVDYLIDDGYQNITVLDISSKSLEKAKKRLGKKADNVNWITCDITEFKPNEKYDFWHDRAAFHFLTTPEPAFITHKRFHDRAAFHFLTTPEDIKKYEKTASVSVRGFMTIGTFSKNGPLKCSGLEITQYNENDLSDVFQNNFERLNCVTEDHTTPFDTTQNFLFCSFKKR